MEGADKSTNYSLWCDLCNSSFNSRAEWYNHLVDDEHQCHARLGMMGWGKEEKEAVLVMFSSVPVYKEAGNLLGWIARKNWRVIVTDFVWWGERPKVAFVRFENRKALEMALERGGGQGQCAGIQVHLQKATELSEIQWNALLPESPLNLELSDLQLCSPSVFNDRSFQFEAISKPVRVPYVEWTYIERLVKHLNRVGKFFEPPFQVLAFRHSFLKLRLPGYSTNWLLHLSCNGCPFPVEKKNVLFNQISNQLNVTQVVDDKDVQLKMGTEFHRQEGSYEFRFTVVTFDRGAIEAQLSRLTEYLLDFDPRCIPLLSLVYFWCDTNDLRVCMDEGTVTRNHSPTCVPGPAALEWMLISFLSGKAKLIPTARMILDRPHTPIHKLKDNRLDIGFASDADYCDEWKASRENIPEEGTNEFYLSVVELAQRFFQYFGNLLQSGHWILNTRDGELVPTEKIVKIDDEQEPELNSEGIMLSQEEVKLVHKAKRRGCHKVKFGETRLYIIHPLHLVCDLRLENEQVSRMQQLMEATGIRLQNWIECQREKGQEVDLATVLKIEGPEVIVL